MIHVHVHDVSERTPCISMSGKVPHECASSGSICYVKKIMGAALLGSETR